MALKYLNRQIVVPLTPTITAGAYIAGDVVGGRLTFATEGNQKMSGMIRSLRMTDNGNIRAALTLYLFNAQPSNVNDNAPFAPTYADLQGLIAVIPIATSDWTTYNADAWLRKSDLNIDFFTANGALYGYLVTGGGPTYLSTTDLSIYLHLWLD